MKITADRVNAIRPVIFGAHAAFEIDLDESSTEDVFLEMWETYGDEFIFGILRSEGYDIVSKPNTESEVSE